VDFDPVRAKAAGRPPAGLSKAIAALFPAAFEDSPLGPIPKGWRVGAVGDLADINGWTLGKRDTLDEIEYIEISEVMRGEIANVAHYVRGSEPGRARRRLRHGDTAFSTVRPDRGSYFLSIEPSPSAIASTGFAVLTAKKSHWAFVHILTTRDEFGQELGRLADGGAYPAVRPEVIASQLAVIPTSDKLHDAFEKVTQPLFLQMNANRKESRTLAALRDALLPKLISGELRVPNAERVVERMA
jgi:type I restriction enzyme S subunit